MTISNDSGSSKNNINLVLWPEKQKSAECGRNMTNANISRVYMDQTKKQCHYGEHHKAWQYTKNIYRCQWQHQKQ